jgi:hypothetical protein
VRNALRWIAVLPAAIAGYVAAVLAVALAIMILPDDSINLWLGQLVGWVFGLNYDSRAVVEEVVSAFFRTLGFVYVGAKVAPNFRTQTAVVLGATILAVVAFFFGVVALALTRTTTDVAVWRIGLYAIFYFGLCVAGVVYGVRTVQKEVAEAVATSTPFSAVPATSI